MTITTIDLATSENTIGVDHPVPGTTTIVRGMNPLDRLEGHLQGRTEETILIVRDALLLVPDMLHPTDKTRRLNLDIHTRIVP